MLHARPEPVRLYKVTEFPVATEQGGIVNVALQEREHATHAIAPLATLRGAFDEPPLRVDERKTRTPVEASERVHVELEPIPLTKRDDQFAAHLRCCAVNGLLVNAMCFLKRGEGGHGGYTNPLRLECQAPRGGF